MDASQVSRHGEDAVPSKADAANANVRHVGLARKVGEQSSRTQLSTGTLTVGRPRISVGTGGAVDPAATRMNNLLSAMDDLLKRRTAALLGAQRHPFSVSHFLAFPLAEAAFAQQCKDAALLPARLTFGATALVFVGIASWVMSQPCSVASGCTREDMRQATVALSWAGAALCVLLAGVVGLCPALYTPSKADASGRRSEHSTSSFGNDVGSVTATVGDGARAPMAAAPVFAFRAVVSLGLCLAALVLIALAALGGAIFSEVVTAVALLVAMDALILRGSPGYSAMSAAAIVAVYAACGATVGPRTHGGAWVGLFLRSLAVLIVAVTVVCAAAHDLETESRKAFLAVHLCQKHLRGRDASSQSQGSKGGGVGAGRYSSQNSDTSVPRSTGPGKEPERRASGVWVTGSKVRPSKVRPSFTGGAAAAGNRGSHASMDSQGSQQVTSVHGAHDASAGTCEPAGTHPGSTAAEGASRGASGLDGAAGFGDDTGDSVFIDLDSPVMKVLLLLESISENFDLSPEEHDLLREVRAALAETASSIWTPNLQSQLAGAELDSDMRSWLFYELAKEDQAAVAGGGGGGAAGAGSADTGAGAGAGLSRKSAAPMMARPSRTSLDAVAGDPAAGAGDLEAPLELTHLTSTGSDAATSVDFLGCSHADLVQYLLSRPGLGVSSAEASHVAEVRRRMQSWEFDDEWTQGMGTDASARSVGIHEVFDRQGPKMLTWFMVSAVEAYGLLTHFNISDAAFAKLMATVERGYLEVPYHCLLHAIDTVQTVYWLLRHAGGDEGMEKAHILAVLLASACHDIGHPGKNNNFLTNTQHALATLYNDRSVLENMHASTTIRLLTRSESEVMHKLPPAEAKAVRELMVDVILGTDLAVHFENLGKFQAKVTSGFDMSKPADRNLKMSTIVHLADVSCPAKTWGSYRAWLPRLFQEFFDQGDDEIRLGHDVAPFMDRRVSSPAKAQLGFCNFIVQPLLEAVAKAVPGLEPKLEHVENTVLLLSKWQELGYAPTPSDLDVSAVAPAEPMADGSVPPPALPGPKAAVPVNLAPKDVPEIYWDSGKRVLVTPCPGGKINLQSLTLPMGPPPAAHRSTEYQISSGFLSTYRPGTSAGQSGTISVASLGGSPALPAKDAGSAHSSAELDSQPRNKGASSQTPAARSNAPTTQLPAHTKEDVTGLTNKAGRAAAAERLKARLADHCGSSTISSSSTTELPPVAPLFAGNGI